MFQVCTAPLLSKVQLSFGGIFVLPIAYRQVNHGKIGAEAPQKI